MIIEIAFLGSVILGTLGICETVENKLKPKKSLSETTQLIVGLLDAGVDWEYGPISRATIRHPTGVWVWVHSGKDHVSYSLESHSELCDTKRKNLLNEAEKKAIWDAYVRWRDSDRLKTSRSEAEKLAAKIHERYGLLGDSRLESRKQLEGRSHTVLDAGPRPPSGGSGAKTSRRPSPGSITIASLPEAIKVHKPESQVAYEWELEKTPARFNNRDVYWFRGKHVVVEYRPEKDVYLTTDLKEYIKYVARSKIK